MAEPDKREYAINKKTMKEEIISVKLKSVKKSNDNVEKAVYYKHGNQGETEYFMTFYYISFE